MLHINFTLTPIIENHLGGCAEFHAGNQLLLATEKAYENLDYLVFIRWVGTQTLYIKSGKKNKPCKFCAPMIMDAKTAFGQCSIR